MTAPLFLRPSFHRRPWGADSMAARFGYDDLPAGPVGECWGVSAHPNGPSTVLGGPHAGATLEQVWRLDRDFFGGGPAEGDFPLLAKFLDAADWLSVQVHPDDAEAVELEGVPLGKTECWYVVAAEPGAEIVLGHRAATREELSACVDAGAWEDVLVRRPVTAGDFVYVPSGTLHAVGPGLLVYEVQQNCDTTYRVWDHDRRDADGNARELHVEKAKRVLTAPHDAAATDTAGPFEVVEGGRRRSLVTGPLFAVSVHEVDGHGYRVDVPTWALCTVVEGSGVLRVAGESYPVTAGDHLVLPADAATLELDGVLTAVVSTPAASAGSWALAPPRPAGV